jgi:hypothetical protein
VLLFIIEREGFKLAWLVPIAGGTKSICEIAWDTLATTKSLFTLHIVWNRNVRFLLYGI